MNWKILVLIVVAVEFLYELILDIIRYRSAENPTPENVADVFDSETYLRWKQYSAENCKLSILANILSTALMFALLLTDAHAAFAKLFPSNVFSQYFSVILLQSILSAIFGAITKYIGVMVIEEKYGFNRTTVKTFVFDQIRSLGLDMFLTIGLVSLLYLLHSSMGDWMIVLFAVALFAIVLLISFLYPFFSRIGNKFTPLEDGELKEKLMALLTKHGYQVKAIEVMDASRRTTKLNAYFTGFGKMKTIVLYDNLVNAMTTDEICGVFAHEMGHGLHKDVLKQQTMNFGNMLLMAVVVWLVVRYPALHTSFGFDGINYGFAYLLMSIGLSLVQPLTGMAMSAYSRHAEYRADRQGVAEGYGEALITALKKLAKENFAHLAPSKILVALEYSHPPLSERISAIEKQLK